MVKFARDCMYKMTEIVCRLEETLGPGTQELRMRFGLHSGPVTAGVLRGEKSRFQLFGDTGTYIECICTMQFRSKRLFVSVLPYIMR